MTEYDDDEIDITLRPAGELMGRLSLLLSTSRRISFEDQAAEATEDDTYALETDRFELFEWVRKTIPRIPTVGELVHLQTPIGRLSDDLVDQHSTDAEAALALGWILGLVPHLTFDLPATSETELLEELAPKPWDRLDKLAKRLRIKDEAEVWAERDKWYLVFLRELVDESERPEEFLADIVADAAEVGFPIRDGDLLVGKVPFSRLDSDFRMVLTGTAEAYVKALTWACGLGETWDEVPIDDI